MGVLGDLVRVNLWQLDPLDVDPNLPGYQRHLHGNSRHLYILFLRILFPQLEGHLSSLILWHLFPDLELHGDLLFSFLRWSLGLGDFSDALKNFERNLLFLRSLFPHLEHALWPWQVFPNLEVDSLLLGLLFSHLEWVLLLLHLLPDLEWHVLGLRLGHLLFPNLEVHLLGRLRTKLGEVAGDELRREGALGHVLLLVLVVLGSLRCWGLQQRERFIRKL